MSRTFSRVGVVGLGTMGAGIVEVFARHGVSVVGVEQDAEWLERGRGHLQRSLDRAVKRGKLGEGDAAAIVGRVEFGTDRQALADVDLVIEAVPETMAVKAPLFAELDAICKPDAVLATNTSSLSITEIATTTQRPGQVVGMHFFNPAPVMKLVEVVHSVLTDRDVVDDVRQFATSLGKEPVVVGDRAGFVANALLISYLNQAAGLYEAGGVSREDLDDAMKLGCGLPMGPLALLDLIGIDTVVQVLDRMYGQSRDRLHAPAPILTQMVTAGLLGRKSGRGFYEYREVAESPVTEVPEPDVSRIGVVGNGPTAELVTTRLAAGGYQVVDVTDAELVLVAADPTGRVIDEAVATGRPAEVVGVHVPTEGVDLVEVVSTVSTSARAEATALALCRAVGLRPVRCDDRAGFVVGRLLHPYLGDAVRMLAARYASTADVDTAMTRGCGYPAGPFAVLDRIGPDVVLAGLRAIAAETGEPGHQPSPLLEQWVAAGVTTTSGWGS